MRRAQPLLGTIVEVRVEAPPCAATEDAIAEAFAAIARVGRLMSLHALDSELSLLNRRGHECTVAVDPWTWDVLAAASRIWAASGGLFDCTVAPVLARDGFLPRELARTAGSNATQADVILLDDCRVRFRRPLALDLGGIAKGFAVDRAIDVLKHHGVAAGAVNAGGDLRVFGPAPEPIHLRDPACPGRLLHAGWLHEGAIATSAAYFARRPSGGVWICPIVEPWSRATLPADDRSVSVIAPDALTADALTKPVTLLGGGAAGLLARFGACALLLCTGGQIFEIRHAA